MSCQKKPKSKVKSKKKLEENGKEIKKLIDQSSSNGSPNKSNKASPARSVKSPPSIARTTKTSEHLLATTTTAKPPPKFHGPQRPRLEVKLPIDDTRSVTPATKSNIHRSKQPHKQSKPPALVISRDPQLEKTDFFILDRRHLEGNLIRLPKEPGSPRNTRFTPAGTFPFLELPKEIRLAIYELLVPPSTYHVHYLNHNAKTHLLTHTLPNRPATSQPRMSADTLARRHTLRKHALTNPDRAALMKDQYSLSSPTALLYLCRKTYPEAASVFYARSTFAFTHLSPLRHFFTNLTLTSKASIKSLFIKHKAYGSPRLTADRMYKVRADRAWERMCWDVGTQCTRLTKLSLDIDYGYERLEFGPFLEARRGQWGKEWMMALWGFYGLENLKRFQCRVRSAITEDAVLEVECQGIRKVVLDKRWDDKAEEKRDGFGFAKGERVGLGGISGLVGVQVGGRTVLTTVPREVRVKEKKQREGFEGSWRSWWWEFTKGGEKVEKKGRRAWC